MSREAGPTRDRADGKPRSDCVRYQVSIIFCHSRKGEEGAPPRKPPASVKQPVPAKLLRLVTPLPKGRLRANRPRRWPEPT